MIIKIKYFDNDNVEEFTNCKDFAIRYRELQKSKLLKKTVESIEKLTPKSPLAYMTILYSYASAERELKHVLLEGEKLYKGYAIIEPTGSKNVCYWTSIYLMTEKIEQARLYSDEQSCQRLTMMTD